MKKQNNLYTGISEPHLVDQYMATLTHPMLDVVVKLRELIRSTDPCIGEGIYWKAPSFYYTGTLPVFDPKEYRRYIAGFVFNRQDCVRMVFLKGAPLDDGSGLLEGTYSDGRRLLVIRSMDELQAKEEAIRHIIVKWLELNT